VLFLDFLSNNELVDCSVELPAAGGDQNQIHAEITSMEKSYFRNG
jgi:hypothetical protein